MPGESILIVEDSPAERDFAQGALLDAGYKVISAGNAAAAMTFPEIKSVSAIVMDANMAGVSGLEATRLLRQQAGTHPIPILLLVPDKEVDNREDFSPRGANGYLLKPYDSRALAKKVKLLIEEQHLDELAHQYLENAADMMMESLAEQHIKTAIERKTQIIIERCIQTVASAIDQRAKAQVNESVTALTAEKEQELVKLTVREVAQSMVEKLAERKVTEAMEGVLADQSEKTVKRIADHLLPGLIRDRLKESVTNTLEREIRGRVERTVSKEVEKEGRELGKQAMAIIEEGANKICPKVVREIAPEIVERKFRELSAVAVPTMVRDQVAIELESQMQQRLDPAIRDAARRLRRTILLWNAANGALVAGLIGLAVYFLFFAKS